jgi:hypothetical protein
MRSVRGNRNLAMSAAVLLVVVVGVGCRGDEASSSRQELPDGTQPVATFVGDGRDALLPGDQRAPASAPVPTTAPRLPIGRPLLPVPADRTPVTRPPLQLTGVVTTTSTSPATTATAPVTPG